VPGFSPVIELVNIPAPVPSEVYESKTVGLDDVLQQTPRAYTEVLPSLVTFPPEEAEFVVILYATFVVTVGGVPPPPVVAVHNMSSTKR